MLIKAGVVTHIGWALRDSTGAIALCEVCEEQGDITRLAAAHREHKPHDLPKTPVKVIITVTECK